MMAIRLERLRSFALERMRSQGKGVEDLCVNGTLFQWLDGTQRLTLVTDRRTMTFGIHCLCDLADGLGMKPSELIAAVEEPG